MIYIDHKDFEKVSGPVLKLVYNTARDVLGPAEKALAKDRATSISRSKLQEDIEGRRRVKQGVMAKDYRARRQNIRKHAKLQSRPKVDKTGINMAKKPAIEDNESHSLRRAIERSKNPKKVLTEVRKTTEPIYAGGNTAANMRGVMRVEEKKFRDKMKKSLGKHSRTSKKSFY